MIFSASSRRVWRGGFRGPWHLGRLLWFGYVLAVALDLSPCRAGELATDVIGLPPLRILSQPARAHTQGLELAGGDYYVTARRDDLRPNRALLLRTRPARTDWDTWDITPADVGDTAGKLDHPGGIQSDGKRLWIPVAESRRNGRSLIRAFALGGMTAGRPLRSELEFFVDDHIGAVAVAAEREVLLGASWDTETVYVWDFRGHLQQTLTGVALGDRGLGVVPTDRSRAGVAVQDWKWVGNRLIASGLFRGPTSSTPDSRSRLLSFDRFLEQDFQKQMVMLPLRSGTELANEGMAVSEDAVYFLPEDLGASNRLFRARLELFGAKLGSR